VFANAEDQVRIGPTTNVYAESAVRNTGTHREVVECKDRRKAALLDGVRLFQGSLETRIFDGVWPGRAEVSRLWRVP
jgi:hypothetical protein